MLFEDQITNIYENSMVGVPQIMRTDIQEKDGSYLLEIELPGFTREDVLAELTEGKLTIIANKQESLEKEDSKINYIRRERMPGGCRRSFYVGKKVKQEDITAAFKDGILSIIINNPEKAVEREERKLIPIK
ncbi:MAG: Hsp20/alpha crystallin family protein [Wujia sp.]